MDVNTQCVILAGGLATRLKPITDNIPKSMIRIANKPFLEYQIELLEDMGVANIVLCVGHKGDMIREYFGDGSNYNVRITYSYEDNLLGTGGALRNAIGMLKDRFFVLYGDAYLTINYRDIEEYFIDKSSPALLTIYRNEGRLDTSNVTFIDDKFVLYDKQNPSKEMQFIDYGLSLLSKSVIKQYIPNNTFYDLADCYNKLSRKNQLLGYEAKERFYEIGSKSGLEEFKEFLERKGCDR